MGTFVFKWEHPASEVYVTGTFDEWKKTEQLEKVGEHFEKSVTLKDASAKIYYKFVVDGNWVTDHTAPKEVDESGNENNVLTPDRIITEAPATAAMINSVTPDSTTAALAAAVPLEEKKDSELPGTFPETPAAEGGDFSVNPLPATDGALNPITLAPGEKIPESLAGQSTTGNVKLDPESYEKSDTLPGGVPVILSSAAPDSTTAALAASAPLEPKVPEVVKESQDKANVDPEASGIAEEVEEKAAVEKELLDKVKEAPSTSEGTAGEGTEKTENAVTPGEAAASVAAAATAVGGAALAGAFAAKDVAVEKATDAATTAQATIVGAATNLPDSVKEQLPESVQNAIGSTEKEVAREEVSPEVPTEVKESIAEAGKAPEAASNTEAVEEKKIVEAELLKEVKPVDGEKEELKTKAAELKDKVTEPAGESSAIIIPPAAEPTATNGTKPAEPVEVKPTEQTSPDTAVKPTEGAAPSGSTKPGTPSTTEKKKKNRLSTIFGKVKSKLSSK
ncbi:carbohydrate-binding module family 48 protein [Hypoxylon rubiginosum]|uniref:Carbohydrate-binding module family 48 protein n=1 Tax=Hypoxylon rubiginosum TaxID=110542 RepID=A0ACB9Z8A0_9PEZI|nr:carbohydrate-binding module family 48 protein [Hypoxylon rubiginosum]